MIALMIQQKMRRRVKKAKEVNIFYPVVQVSKEVIKEACRPWKKAIIVKLLGKRLGLHFLRNRLLKVWCPVGDMEMIDLENDYFLLRFSDSTDVA